MGWRGLSDFGTPFGVGLDDNTMELQLHTELLGSDGFNLEGGLDLHALEGAAD